MAEVDDEDGPFGPIPGPPKAKVSPYDLEHHDIVDVVDRVVALLMPVFDEPIWKNMPKVQFDLDDAVTILKAFKNRVIVDAYAKGKMAWQTPALTPEQEADVKAWMKRGKE